MLADNRRVCGLDLRADERCTTSLWWMNCAPQTKDLANPAASCLGCLKKPTCERLRPQVSKKIDVVCFFPSGARLLVPIIEGSLHNLKMM